MPSTPDPQQLDAQTRRQRFLKDHGINPKDQQLAVHTLQQVQDVALKRTDAACVYYLRKWERVLRKVQPTDFDEWLSKNLAVFSAVSKTRNEFTGDHSLVYCYYRKKGDFRRAFEIRYKITPQLDGNGLFRFDVDHGEIPFPANIKIQDNS